MLSHNQRVIGKIKNTLILDAKIYVDTEYEKNSKSTHRYYLCHNNSSYDGSESPNKLGYKYSWVFYKRFSDTKYSDEVEILEGFEIKDKINISDDVISFISIENIHIMYLFLIKKGRFEKYESLSLNKEFIQISSQELNKIIEIKIGRFIRSLIDDISVNNTFFDFKEINNNYLEDISNKFKKFVNDDLFKLEIVKGNDILKGYTRDNYFLNESSLGGSCMTDKFDFLEIYTKNPNIELAILYYSNKVIARCLIWNINEQKIHDKIYSNKDWAFITLKSILKNKNIDFIDSKKHYIIQLEHIPEFFPYVDNMRYLDLDKKQLTNIRKDISFNTYLNSQSGDFSTLS